MVPTTSYNCSRKEHSDSQGSVSFADVALFVSKYSWLTLLLQIQTKNQMKIKEKDSLYEDEFVDNHLYTLCRYNKNIQFEKPEIFVNNLCDGCNYSINHEYVK